jgi:hypothetical protein
MVLTKPELIGSLQNEVRILVHLASKVEPSMVDYRPTPKQRSTLELLQYLTIMGPQLVKAAKGTGFDPAAWTEAEAAAKQRDFAQTVKSLEAQSDTYASLLSDMTDEQLREEMDFFGRKSSRGALSRESGAGGSRSVSHAAVRVPEGLRPRRAEHDESVGWHGRPRGGYVVDAFFIDHEPRSHVSPCLRGLFAGEGRIASS